MRGKIYEERYVEMVRPQAHMVRTSLDIYKIRDEWRQTLWTFFQKIFGLGTIHIDSSDKDLGNFDIINIKKSYDVKELISQTVESERIRNRVTAREYMSDNDDNDSDDHDDHDVSYEFENDSDDDK